MDFSNLTSNNEVTQETDVLGGGNGPLDSGVYTGKITMAYMDKSKGGAQSLNCTFELEGGRELRQTFWMTSGTAKGCKNYYEAKDGSKNYLPGFIAANHISLLTVGKEIGEELAASGENKVIKLYDFEQKKEVPTEKFVVVGLLNQDISLGVMKHKVDKTAKGEDGAYHPTGETREINEVEKIFRARDGFTVTEIRAQATEASFKDSWAKKWTGEIRDKSSKDAGAVKTGAPGQTAAAAKPTNSLFG